MSASSLSVRARLGVHPLESRLTPTVSVGGGYLSFRGNYYSTATYTATVSPFNATTLLVIENGRSQLVPSRNVSYILYEGGIGNDVFVNNTSVPSAAQGFEGNDTLVGGSGNDVLIAGRGANFAYGRGGNDQIELGDVYGAPLPNAASGGAGDDTITGGYGNDTLLGDAGNDTMNGKDGNDYMDGGADRDYMEGAKGNDTMFGGTGADALYGMDGDDVLDGGVDGANDYLHAGGGRNRIRRDFSLGANYNRDGGAYFDPFNDRYFD